MIIDLKELIDDDLIYNYFSYKVENAEGKMHTSLKGFPIKGKIGYIGYDFYCDYLSIILHSKITPHVSKIIDKQIIPSFCFTRMYFEDSKLNFHTDRGACEITVSHCHYGEPWKIYISEDDYVTEKGVSLYYEGVDKLHGRIGSISNKALYTFFHWVEKDGKYDEFKYDKSEKLKKVYNQSLDKLYI